MYLVPDHHTANGTYQIRQSYRDRETGRFRHRLIFDLGTDPTDHLEPLGETVVFFSTALEEAIGRYTEQDTGPLLEDLLWQFLPRATRHHLSRFHRGDHYVPGPLTDSQRREIDEQMHIFDRRRLYYLHYRAIDQSRLFTMRERAYRPLLGQCRDEREYFFAKREGALEPGEYRNYLYASLDLQRHFPVSFATFMPEALPEDEVADRFVESLCELNASPSFWAMEPPSRLHHHLVRYLVMFFDYTPASTSFEQEFVRRFMNTHRTFRWPEKQVAASEKRISEIFGRSLADLRKMDRTELSRLYRKMAMSLHPDQGGDQESFVELTEIYTTLLQGK